MTVGQIGGIEVARAKHTDGRSESRRQQKPPTVPRAAKAIHDRFLV
jgi:hypothetical protein